MHSNTVTTVRTGIASRAKHIQVQRQEAMKAGKRISDPTLRALLEKEFGKVVDAVYGTLRIKEQEAEKKLVESLSDDIKSFTTLLD
jgi:Skp family chaperone for outer membrane proteins